MKLKRKPFPLILGAGITIYFVALLMQCSFQHLIGQDANMISAFGSMLSGIGTIFAAVVAAYLFNDWKSQHNKQVVNDFALRTYTQFKNTESILFEANDNLIYIINDSESIYEDERPIALNDPIPERNKARILKFHNQISLVENEFKRFISQLGDFSIVTNREDEIYLLKKQFMEDFSKLNNENEDYNYSEYKQFLEIMDNLLNGYFKLISKCKTLIVNNLLKELQE